MLSGAFSYSRAAIVYPTVFEVRSKLSIAAVKRSVTDVPRNVPWTLDMASSRRAPGNRTDRRHFFEQNGFFLEEVNLSNLEFRCFPSRPHPYHTVKRIVPLCAHGVRSLVWEALPFISWSSFNESPPFSLSLSSGARCTVCTCLSLCCCSLHLISE